jgi:hypothetical protein
MRPSDAEMAEAIWWHTARPIDEAKAGILVVLAQAREDEAEAIAKMADDQVYEGENSAMTGSPSSQAAWLFMEFAAAIRARHPPKEEEK